VLARNRIPRVARRNVPFFMGIRLLVFEAEMSGAAGTTGLGFDEPIAAFSSQARPAKFI
jgi:hypothetical protein